MTRERSKLENTRHEYVQERLSPYLDGQLSAAERARVEAHLRTCQSCHEDLRTLRWTKGLLQQVPPLQVPRSFVIREADVTPRRALHRRGRLFAVQWATAIVAILLVLVVAGDMLTGAWLQSGREQPAALVAYEQATTVEVTVEVEREVVVEKQVLVEKPVESQPRAAPEERKDEPLKLQAMPTPAGEEAAEADEAQRPPKALNGGAAPAGTPTAVAMMAEGAAAEQTPTATPMPMAERESKAAPEGMPPPQEPPSTTEQAEKRLPATVTVQATQADKQLPAAEATQLSQPQEVPIPPSVWGRVGWRLVEVGLGILLIGLVIALTWTRRRT